MLSSWNDTNTKKALIDFVERVTKKDGPDFVSEPERIAVFDNDGTLWCEQPTLVEVFFALDRIKELAAKDPSLKETQPYKAFLELDLKTIHAMGKKGIVEFVFKTHAAKTQEDFYKIVADWFSTATHPRFKQPFTECVYQPQVEALDYLRTNCFKIFIVTAGGIEFVRTIAEKTYGIPREQVIGSSVKTQFQFTGKKTQVDRLEELNSFDDREEKVVNIDRRIGRRPLIAFGNSDGDLAMMKYTLGGEGLRMAVLLHHDDPQREFVYDKNFEVSPLKEALDVADEWGIHVVSMKNDWKKVFAFQ